MSSKTIISTVFLYLLFVYIPRAQSTDYDITTKGGKPDADISTALLDSFKAACAEPGSSKVIVPKGTYKTTAPLVFAGPCKGKVEFQIQGTLQAPATTKGDTWISFLHIDDFTLSGGGTFDGQSKVGGGTTYNIRFDFLTNALIHDITSLDSKSFHVNILGCNNLTMQKFTATAPANSANTDGIHIGRSKGVTITDSTIGTGDDCISIGDGSQQLHITNVKCGPGHGISVGSLGRYPNEEPVSGVFVTACTLTNTNNGVRIKSFPGLQGGTATDMHFEDITMDNVQFPVIIDQEYCPWNKCNKGTTSKVKISNVTFKGIKGTSATPEGVKLICSKGIPCEGVTLEDIDLKPASGGAPLTATCSNVKPQIAGTVSTAGCDA